MSKAISDARSILAARTNERDLAEIANSRLHATVDLLTRERDALSSRLDDFISARATGRSANDD